jgi:RecB family endonuclease NucS
VFRAEPSPVEAVEVLESAIAMGGMVTIVGECEVEYDGRASSYLSPGDRLVILKPDGTLLVHTDSKHEPVNWQPPGCTHRVSLENDHLHVQSLRSSPAEQVEIAFESIAQLSTFELADESTLALEGTEEDLRKRIFAEPELIEEGFQPLTRERETSAGPVDIYGKDREGRPVIIELKRRRVGPDAVGQLTRYVAAMDSDLPVDTTPRGILIAPSVTDRAKRLLDSEELESVSLAPPDSKPVSGLATQLSDFDTEE